MDNYRNYNPAASIIMNCRNGEEYLREALDSVYAQSYKNWEIIFWDNASSDDSAAIAQSYDVRLRYFKNAQTLTLGEARNLAMTKARGRYVAFLDCDDKWLPYTLERQTSLLDGRSDVDFVYGNYFRMFMPQIDNLVLGLRGRQPEGEVFGHFLCNYPVGLQTVMLRMDAVKRLNSGFDEHLELAEEYDFFMRILFKSKALYIDEPLAIYRVHQNMSSRKLLHKHPAEIRYILDKLKKMDNSIETKYASQIKYYEAKLGYWYAKVEMERGNSVFARARLVPYKFTSYIFFILYTFTYLPPIFWQWLHHHKMKGKFRWLS